MPAQELVLAERQLGQSARVSVSGSSQHRFVSTPGSVTLGPDEVVARLSSRTYSPVMRSAELPELAAPWCDGRRLRFEFDSAPTRLG